MVGKMCGKVKQEDGRKDDLQREKETEGSEEKRRRKKIKQAIEVAIERRESQKQGLFSPIIEKARQRIKSSSRLYSVQ